MTRETGIILTSGDLNAEIRPDIGGSLSRFWTDARGQTIDWMRRAGPAEIAAADARGMACYPLVPFSNRIRNGRFRFEGRDIRLPLNYRPHPHIIHGHGWQAPWQVAGTTGSTARLQYRHAADAWPWSYLVEQRFTLDDQGLAIAISITNLSGRPMPAGLGLHPYFPRDAATTITGTVEGLWESDAEVMPTERVSAGSVWPAGQPLQVDAMALDNCFTGWGKALDIRWGGHDRALRVEARGPLDFLIVFTPPGQDYFCAEPVSHCIDAVNLAAGRNDTGLVSLGPNETLSGEVIFRPA